MKLGNLVDKKDYDFISFRMKLPEKYGGDDIFIGAATSKNGELISLDGDSYSKDCEIESFEEWSNEEENVKNGLTVVLKGE